MVADAGIDARVPQHAWDGIVAGLIGHARDDRLAAGFETAVASVGALLAAHFPRAQGDRNELDDHGVEL